eukprot:TRINITY_DN8385_c0_g2_i2.p1 TRINITY_DN8385_c0_g2~~TRINITY_DN8385_c0_g2_i2.p1  ORF type:complete len:269 (+),score=16.18 TRINITY_DN8385_c0_g2_i2:204-1010(+)
MNSSCSNEFLSSSKVFWIFAHIASIVVQLIILFQSMPSITFNTPSLLQPNSSLFSDFNPETVAKLTPNFVSVCIVWLPLYLVLALSFSGLSFSKQANRPPTFACSLLDPAPIKEVKEAAVNEDGNKEKNGLRKISRDSVQTTFSENSPESPSIAPNQVAIYKVTLTSHIDFYSSSKLHHTQRHHLPLFARPQPCDRLLEVPALTRYRSIRSVKTLLEYIGVLTASGSVWSAGVKVKRKELKRVGEIAAGVADVAIISVIHKALIEAIC